jgi:hypothetical protein
MKMNLATGTYNTETSSSYTVTYITNTLQVSTVTGKTTTQTLPPSALKYAVVTAPTFSDVTSTAIYDSVETDAKIAFCYNGAVVTPPAVSVVVVVSAPTRLVNQTYDLY